jgi:hypothetical protein
MENQAEKSSWETMMEIMSVLDAIDCEVIEHFSLRMIEYPGLYISYVDLIESAKERVARRNVEREALTIRL